MPRRCITLPFRHQQAQIYRVDLRTADGRNDAGTLQSRPSFGLLRNHPEQKGTHHVQ
jgi:hypothetical protein